MKKNIGITTTILAAISVWQAAACSESTEPDAAQVDASAPDDMPERPGTPVTSGSGGAPDASRDLGVGGQGGRVTPPAQDAATPVTIDAGGRDAMPPVDPPPNAPLRLVTVVTFHGVAESAFWPQQPGPLTSMTATLKPLEKYRDRLLVVRGVDMERYPANSQVFDDDMNYGRLLLTGKGSVQPTLGGTPQVTAQAPSIDRLFAAATGSTPLGAICATTMGGQLLNPYWTSPGQPVQCYSDVRSFSTLVERPDLPVSHAFNSLEFIAEDVPELIKSAAHALSTRRASAFGLVLHPNQAYADAVLKPQGDLHQELHNYARGNPEAVALAQRLNLYQASTVASLAAALEAKPESGGNLLRNTVIVWISALATPGHGFANLPVVIIGDAKGKLKTGAFVDVGRRSYRDLLATLGKALEVPGTSFPPAGVTAAPIQALLK